MSRTCRLGATAIFALVFMFPLIAHAAVVGHFTLVQGQVDLLKNGKLPAVPAKLQAGVEPGDIIRTKSKAKAQVKFVDGSIITMAPESRLAVADYVYDPARGQRRTMVRLFRGMVHTMVTRILGLQAPEFIVESHTAVMGVRGTEWYSLLMPNSTSIYLLHGLLEVKSTSPNLAMLVLLKDMQFTQVQSNMPPQLPKPISPAMLQMLQKMMNTGIRSSALMEHGTPGAAGPGGLSGFKLPLSPDQLTQPVIPPPAPPPPPPPPPPSPPSGLRVY